MKRLPVIPTMVVGLAVLAMLVLGVWQLQRRGEKEALIARYIANLNLPPMAYPQLAPVPPEAMFRKARVHCLRVAGWRIEGGRTPGGQAVFCMPGYARARRALKKKVRPAARAMPVRPAGLENF